MKISERDKKDEKIQELVTRLKDQEQKRMQLEKIKDKNLGEIERLKTIIDKLKGNLLGYKQSSFDDMKKSKMLE